MTELLDRSEVRSSKVAPRHILGLELEGVDADGLAELMRRVREIDNAYRAAAEKLGQLYMLADLKQLAALTRRLDRPMRNASRNEQAFAAILDELQMRAVRRKPVPRRSAAR